MSAGIRLVMLGRQLDVELALVGAPSILARFGAADLVAYGAYER